jgi:hypothetical protein
VPIRTLSTSNTGLTVVQTVAPSIVIGTTARILRGGLDELARRTTVDFDAGALWSAPAGLRVGVTGRNLREPEFDGGSEVFEVKRQFRAGIALAPRSLQAGVHGPFTVAFDADLTSIAGPQGDVRMAAAGGILAARRAFGARAASDGPHKVREPRRFRRESAQSSRGRFSWKVK